MPVANPLAMLQQLVAGNDVGREALPDPRTAAIEKYMQSQGDQSKMWAPQPQAIMSEKPGSVFPVPDTYVDENDEEPDTTNEEPMTDSEVERLTQTQPMIQDKRRHEPMTDEEMMKYVHDMMIRPRV